MICFGLLRLINYQNSLQICLADVVGAVIRNRDKINYPLNFNLSDIIICLFLQDTMSKAYGGGKKRRKQRKAQKKQTPIRSLSFFYSLQNLLKTGRNWSTKAETLCCCSLQERAHKFFNKYQPLLRLDLSISLASTGTTTFNVSRHSLLYWEL